MQDTRMHDAGVRPFRATTPAGAWRTQMPEPLPPSGPPPVPPDPDLPTPVEEPPGSLPIPGDVPPPPMQVR